MKENWRNEIHQDPSQSLRFSFIETRYISPNERTKFLIRPGTRSRSIPNLFERKHSRGIERDREPFENDAAWRYENPSGFNREMNNSTIEKNNWYADEKDSFGLFYGSLSLQRSRLSAILIYHANPE